MLAKDAPAAFSDKDWIFEIKWDGFRAISYIDHTFSVKSRNEKELKYNFPELNRTDPTAQEHSGGRRNRRHEAKANPTSKRCWNAAKPFQTREIERRTKRSPATYIVFDILEKDGKPLTNAAPDGTQKNPERIPQPKEETCSSPTSSRKKAKPTTVWSWKRAWKAWWLREKTACYEEGLRTGSWLKIKKLKTCDCVIFGYREAKKSGAKTFGSLVLGFMTARENPFTWATSAQASLKQMLEYLMDKFEKLKVTAETPFNVEAGGKGDLA